MQIQDIFKICRNQLDRLDLELLIAYIIKKPREFVLAHPEFSVNKKQEAKINKFINRRLKNEPIAYILGQKEFYGLPFKVNKNTLVPRPETELLVEQALQKIQETVSKKQKNIVIDLGTGSGNIIVALAKNLEDLRIKNYDLRFFATDISTRALKIAKQNAKLNKVDKKIKFIQSDLLKYFLDHRTLLTENCIITANLPYLSKKIYNSTMPDVKNFEPKSALYSFKKGLAHYKKLFSQLKKMSSVHCSLFTVFVEFSPEQKPLLQKIIRQEFPKSKITFHRDLSQKWRILKLEI